MSSKSKKTVYADSVLYNQSDPSNSAAWREWSDSELNNEAWDYPKNGEFVDPQAVPMPPSLRPGDWKRFRKLENIVDPLVFEPITGYADFITNNKHLLHSEFMRCFVSTMINLQYCGRNGLQVEDSSANFSWNFSEQPWRGYFHVYSSNKAGKGVAHEPIINSNGKYIVRIFFMGRWRRVLIDDAIPVDKRGKPLLPRTANDNELWPMILAKAILKIAAISWTGEREIVDCNIVTCLTGWIGLSLNVSHLSPRDQWEFLTKYAKHFEWPRDDRTTEESTNSGISEKDSKKQSRRTKNAAKKKLQVPEETRPVLLFLNLEDMRDVDAEEIPGIAPCWNHQIYVELSRDVPLDPAQVKPPLAKWKQHRWLDWAISRGLIDASDYLVPVRHLLIVSPLREFSDRSIYNEDSETPSDHDSSKTTIASVKKQLDETKPPPTKTLPRFKSREIELREIGLWGDFNKLSLYLREVCLFYRRRFFGHSVEIADIASRDASQEGRKSRTDQASTKDGKKSAAKSVLSLPPIAPRTYEYDDKISTSRNEALYLFVDSVEEKFFLVDLSASRQETSPESPKKASSLIVERYSIFSGSADDRALAVITTRGAKSTVLQLESGRHLLRIFISTECSYRATVLSDTPFRIGNRSTMHELMSRESERIRILVEKISENARATLESFGASNYSSNLKFYYRSYMPEIDASTDLVRKALKSIHRYYHEELFGVIEKRFSADESKSIKRALRIFFIDPKIGMAIDSIERQSEIDGDDDRRNKSASLIQSLFRGFIVRRYKEIHESGHEEHDRVKRALSRVVELFGTGKHESVAQTLLRGALKRERIFESLYPCAKDFEHVIEIRELNGRITNATPNLWIPIVRVVVNAPRGRDVFASIDLFADLSNFNVRVFDNDTKLEMARLVDNVAPTRYEYRENGYTIFAYGSTDFSRTRDIEWKLHIATRKNEPMLCWLNNEEPIAARTEIKPPIVEEISGIYVPNNRNRIARIELKIGKRSLVSLRLRVSYKSALTRLRIIDETGRTLSEIEGGGTLILPAIFLDFASSDRPEIPSSAREDEKSRRAKRSSNRRSAGSLSHRSGVSRRETSHRFEEPGDWNRYIVEASLREDSWPLTESEWAAVAEEKTKSLVDKTKLGRPSVRSKLSRIERKSKQFGRKSRQIGEESVQPYWILQIISDAGNDLEITRDGSGEERIEELNENWKIDDADRSTRGRRLREKFLQDNSIIVEPSSIDATDEEAKIAENERNVVDSVVSIASEVSSENKRTLRPPADPGHGLPKMNLAMYMEKEDEEEDTWVKTEFDEETLRNRRAMNVLDFQQLQSIFLKESAQLMDRRRRKDRTTGQRHAENFASRARAIDEAYEMRQAYVDSTKSTRSVKSKTNKVKKGT